MHAAAGVSGFPDQLLKGREVSDLVPLDGAIDPGQLLQHDPATAEIHVANLGIAELPIGQADLGAIGAQKAVWCCREPMVEHRRIRQRHGVVGTLGAIAPSVENTEHNWTLLHVRPTSGGNRQAVTPSAASTIRS